MQFKESLYYKMYVVNQKQCDYNIFYIKNNMYSISCQNGLIHFNVTLELT